MKKLWGFFSSVKLTIILAAIICVVAAWGSVLTVDNPRFYRAMDSQILAEWLMGEGALYPSLTAWIYLLIFLVFLFTVNTVVCTADKVWAIVKAKRPVQALFPHIVHVGFCVALLGHLVGSVAGFKTYGHTVFVGSSIPVPGNAGLNLRLDGFELEETDNGELKYLKSAVTLIKDGREVKKDAIEINGPAFYRGTAFYHLDQGTSPDGVVIETGDGERTAVRFNGSFTAPGGAVYSLGYIYPDFAVDEKGEPYSRTGSYRNPHIELIAMDGGKGRAVAGYLDVSGPGAVSVVNGAHLVMREYLMAEYVVLAISRDPGIWFIIIGSSILTIGMLLLLFFRGERSELVRRGAGPGQ